MYTEFVCYQTKALKYNFDTKQPDERAKGPWSWDMCLKGGCVGTS